VRHALALTIDREGINKSILEGRGKVCHLNQISISQKEWKDRWAISYDPARAKQLLKEAGYEKGFEIPLWVGPSGVVPEIGDAIAGLWQADLNVTAQLDRSVYTSKHRPGLVQRNTSVPWITTGDEGRSNFPVHWPKGFQGSSLTTGGWGPGFENVFYTQNHLKMTKELDIAKRLQLAEEWYDYQYNWMLSPCIVEEPYHPMFNTSKVKEWDLLPSANGNMSGVNNLESVVLAP
jgi:ABC-type transport system substrate-binding protein